MTNKLVLGVSGGMDSSVLLHMAASVHTAMDVYAIFFDYGQRHKDQEYRCALRQIDAVSKRYKNVKLFKVIELPFIREIAPTSSLTNNSIDTPKVSKTMGEAQPLSYVPNRNLMFLSILASFAEAHGITTIYHGSAQADSLAGYWDSSNEFRDSLNSLLSLNRSIRIEVMTPLINMSKKNIIETGVKLGVDFADTYTCYSGEELADAESVSSSLRIKGFIDAGYIDPIQYKQDLSAYWTKYNCKPIPPVHLLQSS